MDAARATRKAASPRCFSALCELARGKSRPRETEIVFAGLIDEENAQSGSRALAASGFKADLAIVGEPTQLQVVTAHKGSLWLQLETRGRAAHGATPQLGRNAVHSHGAHRGCAGNRLRGAVARPRHPLLGRATVNVGTIHGGTQANIVPDRCTISVDRRTLPGETEPAVRREIGALLRRRGLSARVSSMKLAPCLPLETDPKLPLVREFLRMRRPEPCRWAFIIFATRRCCPRAAIPSVVFGPGDIAQAHTADEWISLAQLERGQGFAPALSEIASLNRSAIVLSNAHACRNNRD